MLVPKSKCYEITDQLSDVIRQFETLIIQEPGSHHQDCFLKINIEGEEFYLQREGKRIVLVKLPLEEDISPVTECNVAKRIAAAKHIPELYELAKEFNQHYYNEAKAALAQLLQHLSSQETECSA
jgi:hypothetical protein